MTTPGLKSNVNCCVPGCKSVRKSVLQLSYHIFPKSGDKISVLDNNKELHHVERLQLWIVKLKIGKRQTKSMTVCSLHFNEDDYVQSGTWNIRKKLKPTAVPSKNLPVSLLNKKTEQQKSDEALRNQHLTMRNLKQATLSPIMMKFTILFPSADEIQRNIPLCFKDLKKTRIVLDCTEIPIQSHRKLCCRVKTYSHYKDTTTITFMTGVSPAGLITFVSAPYGGSVSDKAIFQQSGLLDMYRDKIMVDKGFLIEDLCWEYGINIIRPPFLRKKQQLTAQESLRNCKIASARAHIDRTNQRIKVFKILTNRLPVSGVSL